MIRNRRWTDLMTWQTDRLLDRRTDDQKHEVDGSITRLLNRESETWYKPINWIVDPTIGNRRPTDRSLDHRTDSRKLEMDQSIAGSLNPRQTDRSIIGSSNGRSGTGDRTERSLDREPTIANRRQNRLTAGLSNALVIRAATAEDKLGVNKSSNRKWSWGLGFINSPTEHFISQI
jgi:hypothetical protein